MAGNPKNQKGGKIYAYNKKFFSSRPGKEPDGVSEIMLIVAFVFSFCAFLMKVKWGVWLSLYSFAFSYVNMSYESDFKQLITSFSLIVAGFLSVYVAPQKPPSP